MRTLPPNYCNICSMQVYIYIWLVVSNIFYVHPEIGGKIPILTHIFSMGLKPPTIYVVYVNL